MLSLLIITILLYLVLTSLSMRANALIISKKGSVLLYTWQCFGVVSHELGHYFFCGIFFHRVTNMALYHPQKNGQLGYVEHQYNNKSFYQNLGNVFIGLGPIASGVAFSWLLTELLWPNMNFPQLIEMVSKDIKREGLLIAFIDNADLFLSKYMLMLKTEPLKFTLWVFIMTSIVNHIMPSKSDLCNVVSGLWQFSTIIFLVYVFNFEQQLISIMNSALVLLLSMLLSVSFIITAIQILTVLLFTTFKNKEV